MLERDESAAQRAGMIEQQLRPRGVHDQAVLEAMRAVPRDAFVPEADRARAYADKALPLGHGQTISQPYMVARAAELAQLSATDNVLEVGLGSGYQAAVLSRLCSHVVGVELLPELAQRAERTLRKLGFDNVSVLVGDGSLGHAACAPYDAIVVAAGAAQVPEALLEQLALGGRLVMPVGGEAQQTLTVITRTARGTLTREYDACVYVPLRGVAGRPDAPSGELT
jgi:protein-L-isoaspartate(D-aspartate) O-methyltransferase